MDPLLQQVRQTIQDYQMLERGHTVLVAVSGGADSMALLTCLAASRAACSAAMRGPFEPPDASRRRRGCPFRRGDGAPPGHPLHLSRRDDVPTYQRQHKLSPEDAARRLRYAFLRATATQLGADRIAVGHTADDQAETVLLHLLRGSGLRGLGGIPPVRGPIIRPLIRRTTR